VLGRRGRRTGPLWADCARTGKKRKIRLLTRGVCGLKEGVGRLKRKEREREEVFSFLKKFFSNSFFKLSNFKQTEIHAFES
jgi:hypothetical protein